MAMLTNHNGPAFSEDITSRYRRDLIAAKTSDYMMAVSAAHQEMGPTPYLLAMVEYRHADMVAAALPPSAERDWWQDRVGVTLEIAREERRRDA